MLNGDFLGKYYSEAMLYVLLITTPISNLSKHYRHFRKTVLALVSSCVHVDNAVSGRGHFENFRRIWVSGHIPC